MNDATGMPQSAVVIGGASEIGVAILRALARGRLRAVILGGRHPEALARAGDELRAAGVEDVQVHPYDVTEPDAHQEFAERAARELGDIDMVLMAAGALGAQASDERDPVATAGVLDTNFTGPAASLVAFTEVLKRQGHGRLVVLSSVAGVRARRANFIYGSAKAGLDAFAQGLGDALVGTGVTVMIVRPGFVHGRMTAGRDPAPMAIDPEDVAAAVVRGLQTGASLVYAPALLRCVFAVFRLLPRAVWRRLPDT